MKRLRILLPLLIVVVLLTEACDPSDPGTSTPPTGPSDTTDVHERNPSRQPGDPVQPDPEWRDYNADRWDSSGVTPEDIDCDFHDLLNRYDPYERGRSWVYQKTISGDSEEMDYLHVRVEQESDFEGYLHFRIREAVELNSVRTATVVGNNYHMHGSYTAYDNYTHPNADPSEIDWSFYCCCAAEAGDTIRFRQHIVEGDIVRRELVQVIGWDETVELPDTSYSQCYTVLIDTLIAEENFTFHRTVTEWYAPGIGLVKRHEELDSLGTQRTTTLEYLPPRTWPWYFIPPTEPGDPGEDILAYFPLHEGQTWDYHFSGTFVPDEYQRTVCGGAAMGQTGHLHFPMNQFTASWEDTTGLMGNSDGGLWYTYNGNQLLRTNMINGDYDAVKEFYRFPDVEPGQVLYDSSYFNGYYSYSERAEVIALGQTVEVDAGTFEDVFVVYYYKGEGSNMNWSGSGSTNYYAPGVGLILRISEGWNYEQWETRKELIAWDPGGGN